MLNEAGVPRGRTWVHPPAPAGSLAGTVLVAVASSLATLTAMLLLLPGLGRGVAAPHSGGTPSEVLVAGEVPEPRTVVDFPVSEVRRLAGIDQCHRQRLPRQRLRRR